MRIIIPGITTLLQHLNELNNNPERYRPSNCIYCGCGGLWYHGYYERKSDRENISSSTLNPIPIFRFYCSHCQHTCSVLPECIPPRRWYLWQLQQAVLLLFLTGHSARAISESFIPSRKTIHRWFSHLRERFSEFSFYLKSRYSELGYYSGFAVFWRNCIEKFGLSNVMFFLNSQGLLVP